MSDDIERKIEIEERRRDAEIEKRARESEEREFRERAAKALLGDDDKRNRRQDADEE